MENFESSDPLFESANDKELWLQQWNDKTNAELAENKYFVEWLKNTKNIEPSTKRQASKHREEFLKLLETKFGENVRKKELLAENQKNIRSFVRSYYKEY